MVQLETAAFVRPADGEETAAPSVVSGAVTLHQFPMITFEVQIASRKSGVKSGGRALKNKKRFPPTSNLSSERARLPIFRKRSRVVVRPPSFSLAGSRV